MGDRNRFHLFADLIAQEFPDRAISIADVASGNGKLQAALRMRGYNEITSWDRQRRNAKGRRGYRFGLFDYRNASRAYDLVIGMHPDEATDQIILYAGKHGKPFVVCPCCIKPSVSHFEDIGFAGWLRHLRKLGEQDGLTVTDTALPMYGRANVLIGRPS